MNKIVDFNLLRKSISEVFWLTLFALAPLILSLSYESIKTSISDAIALKLTSSEVLAYCVSFLAPSIFFIKKTHGKSINLPFLDFYLFLTVLMYGAGLCYVFVLKNNIDPKVVQNVTANQMYLWVSLSFLVITITFRIYSIYHSNKPSDFIRSKVEEQKDFNNEFKDTLNQSTNGK